MKNYADIPCATCELWNQEKKIFSCSPSNCKRLSHWLMKHTREATGEIQNRNVQYVV